MNEEVKKSSRKTFRERGDVPAATEAASKGLNLQVADIFINYDLPWNPSGMDRE